MNDCIAHDAGLRPTTRKRWGLLAIFLLALTTGRSFTAASQLAILEGPDFGTVSIGVVDGLPVSATGGSVYTWTLSSGSLPPGLSIRTDIPTWFPAGASAGLIGVATTPGTYTFTLRVTSGTDLVEKVCTITITSLVVKDGPRVPDAFVGAPFSYALTAERDGSPIAAI